MHEYGKLNDGFQTRYSVLPIRNNPRLQKICSRKSGYCLVFTRVSVPSDSKVPLGEYGYFWNGNRKVVIERMQFELSVS